MFLHYFTFVQDIQWPLLASMSLSSPPSLLSHSPPIQFLYILSRQMLLQSQSQSIGTGQVLESLTGGDEEIGEEDDYEESNDNK
jgi:hypothetical protein